MKNYPYLYQHSITRRQQQALHTTPLKRTLNTTTTPSTQTNIHKNQARPPRPMPHSSTLIRVGHCEEARSDYQQGTIHNSRALTEDDDMFERSSAKIGRIRQNYPIHPIE